jgi:putative oxidoreductase
MVASDLATLAGGLLVVRLALGLVMAAHGAQKLFGWFGGYGIAGTGGFLESLGFRPGRVFATAAALAEFGGGLLVALGFLGPVGPALIISVMVVAALTVHRQNGFFVASNGIEVPLVYSTLALALALTGYGASSLDAVLGLQSLWTPPVTSVVVGLGILGAIANLLARRPPARA